MKLSTTISVFAFAVALTGGAYAADLGVYVPAPEPAPMFDWNGFYAGLGVTGGAWWNGADVTQGSIDGIVGVNVTTEQFLFGIEGQLSGYADNASTTGWLARGSVRAGYLVTNEALLYVALSGLHFDGGANYAGVGGGVEFVVTDNMTIDLEGTYYPWTDNGTWQAATASVSALWHF